MRMFNLKTVATATLAQGVGVYAYHLIRNNTEPGTMQRWLWVSGPALVGLVTPLALELMDRFNISEQDEEV